MRSIYELFLVFASNVRDKQITSESSLNDNSSEYQERTTDPENTVFSGFSYILNLYETPQKQTKYGINTLK